MESNREMVEFKEELRTITPSEFFTKHKQFLGHENPTKSALTSIRELVENSLDSAENANILPEIKIYVKTLENMYEVKVIDNGTGIKEKDIPKAFAEVLTSTKYVNKQYRGLLGLGGKFVLIMGQVNTRKPFAIISAVQNSRYIYAYVMEVDLKNNRPIIHKHQRLNNKYNWRGTIVKFYSTADFLRARNRIINYLKLTSIVCPYATILFYFDKQLVYEFKRVTTHMPKPPKIVKFHPHGIDAQTLDYLIKSSKNSTLAEFMTKNFQRVGETIANKFLKYCEMQNKDIHSLTREEIKYLAEKMKEYNKFLAPTSECLSPIGEAILKQGLFVNYEPEYVCYTQRKGVLAGHPFIIEVAVGYGGKIKKGLHLLRYANRMPLVYDSSSCMMQKVLDNINLHQYRINEETPLVVVVHICSTKVPYKTVGKEYISADFEELNHIMKLCYGDVFRKVRDYISKRVRYEHSRKRLNILKKYLTHIITYTAETLNKPKINVDEIVK
jgi:DNA topoisomerase-6 subunit B